jgi:hypothetical protein
MLALGRSQQKPVKNFTKKQGCVHIFMIASFVKRCVRSVATSNAIPGALLLRCAVVHCVDSRAEWKSDPSQNSIHCGRFGFEKMPDTASTRQFLYSVLTCFHAPVPDFARTRRAIVGVQERAEDTRTEKQLKRQCTSQQAIWC